MLRIAKSTHLGNAQRVATKGGADESRPEQKELTSVMRRIKLVVGDCVAMAAILALSAGSAMANDGRHHQDDNKKHDNNKKFFNDHDDFEVLDLRDDFSDHGFVDFGENDGESALFAAPDVNHRTGS